MRFTYGYETMARTATRHDQRLGGLACLSLVLGGCTGPTANEPHAKQAPTQGAVADAPLASRGQQNPPFGPVRFTIVGRDGACPGKDEVEVRALHSDECFRRVTPEQLASSEFWSRPVLLEGFEWQKWDRKLECKSEHCLYRGLGIRLENGVPIPVRTLGPRPPWTSTDVLCETGQDCTQTRPNLEPGRAWIGIVRPHFTADSSVPTLTFDLLGVEQPAE